VKILIIKYGILITGNLVPMYAIFVNLPCINRTSVNSKHKRFGLDTGFIVFLLIKQILLKEKWTKKVVLIPVMVRLIQSKQSPE
jgi:hypothetical protein